MTNEKNLYKSCKEKLKDLHPIRIETTTINGFPDIICFNKFGNPIFIECKVCDRSKLLQSLRPHQKAFHYKYSKIMNGLFILQRCLASRKVFLYRSLYFDFLGHEKLFEPIAEDNFASKWCAISAQLKNMPLDMGGG